MPTPTSLSVVVDNTEYSRYERNNDTVTATVTASGGAPYTSVPIIVELVKARQSRDSAVGVKNLVLTSPSDNVEFVESFPLNDLVDNDLISLVRHGRYFVKATYEATSAEAQIGTGPNGIVYIERPPGEAGNDYTIEVVIPGGTSPLTVTTIGTAITVSLATSSGVPTAVNTALMVANGLQVAGYIASVSGDGTGLFSTVIAPVSFAGGTDTVIGESEDFDIRILTVERFKRDWLFGIDLKSTRVLGVKFQPTAVTGVTIIEVSPDHPKGLLTLSYIDATTHTNATAAIGSGPNGVVTVTAVGEAQGSDGNYYNLSVVAPAGTSGLSVSLVSNILTVNLAVASGTPTSANTATAIATAIDALAQFSAVASGTGASTITTTSNTAFTGGVTNLSRLLSWAGGPAVAITKPGKYILSAGSGAGSPGCSGSLSSTKSKHYIVVRVKSLSALPTSSVSEDILIEADTLSDETLARYLAEAIAYVENDLLATYIEPTVVVTERDTTTIQYSSGINAGVPIYTNQDYDFIVSPLTYFVPNGQGRWIQIQTPYPQLLRVDSLYGAIANTRVITIDLSWIEHAEQTGFIQLVPFNNETAFDFLGLVWVNAMRGAIELPNFWHFNMLVGLRNTPPELQEYIGKLAGVTALTAASLAFRPGISSLSLSRDGVSESTSFNTAAQYGVYSGTIQAYKDWLEEKERNLKAKYRGLRMVVV